MLNGGLEAEEGLGIGGGDSVWGGWEVLDPVDCFGDAVEVIVIVEVGLGDVLEEGFDPN
ncbi:hypothetical protein KI659_16435 [Litoribacter alkaliphilus]|uniref:Uncharacterized protein n=1 Tax=Litoribacter ruber TaxID=702568 RepID=A0AAP2G2D6_9BACT|nr:hypothetical protein [Litoribacter alkaliphilus]MBS9525607.1 hypothetical protein [Litoribacter alkaliphilus]